MHWGKKKTLKKKTKTKTLNEAQRQNKKEYCVIQLPNQVQAQITNFPKFQVQNKNRTN